jgi:malonyl-CoA/methylmalonyl-CoA synthetase
LWRSSCLAGAPQYPYSPPIVSETLLARVERLRESPRVALIENTTSLTYAALDARSRQIASQLLDGRDTLGEARVGLLVPPGFDYVAVLLGIWRAGGIAVPLAMTHPPAERGFVIEDSDASIVVASPELFGASEPAESLAAAPALQRFVVQDGTLTRTTGTAKAPEKRPEPPAASGRRAMILYTSGTTGKPKGVVSTHEMIAAQISTLVAAWEWRPEDRTLLVLPLHHVHGIINVLGCALWCGATCEIFPRFDAEATWDRLASGDITIFTAVPTIYYRLVASWDSATADIRRRRSEGAGAVRLMMSGSAALPVGVLERWRDISGHVLLERYGMTEIGMAIANPLRGVRQPGRVGQPLPGVDVRLVGEDGHPVAPGSPGELEVRGPTVFAEYWRRPDATRAAFRDGWFRTGDIAVVEDGVYRLLGRTSIDIIKTGGYKISALEIEDVLRAHPAIAECAVVGIDDEEWGQRVCAAVELKNDATLTAADLEPWARERLAPYKVPRTLMAVPALPRNAMGKVVKPDVAALFQKSHEGQRPQAEGQRRSQTADGKSGA